MAEFLSDPFGLDLLDDPQIPGKEGYEKLRERTGKLHTSATSALTPESQYDRPTEVSKEGLSEDFYSFLWNFMTYRGKTKYSPEDTARIVVSEAESKDDMYNTAIGVVMRYVKMDEPEAIVPFLAELKDDGEEKFEGLTDTNMILRKVEEAQGENPGYSVAAPYSRMEIANQFKNLGKLLGYEISVDEYSDFVNKDAGQYDVKGAREQYKNFRDAARKSGRIYNQVKRAKRKHNLRRFAKHTRETLYKGLGGTSQPIHATSFIVRGEGTLPAGAGLTDKRNGPAFHKAVLGYSDADLGETTYISHSFMANRFGINMENGVAQEDGTTLVDDKYEVASFAQDTRIDAKVISVGDGVSRIIHPGDKCFEGGIKITAKVDTKLAGSYAEDHPDRKNMPAMSQLYIGHMAIREKTAPKGSTPSMVIIYHTEHPITPENENADGVVSFEMKGEHIDHMSNNSLTLVRTMSKEKKGKNFHFTVETKIKDDSAF